MASKTLTTTEVASRLGVSRQTAHRYLVAGKIPAQKTPGGDFRVDEAVLDLFMRRSDGAKLTGPRIIALANQKGGVGKTTTAVNMAEELSVLGERVLLVDIDPQANATRHLGLNPYALEMTTYEVMSAPKQGAERAIMEIHDGLDLLPAKIDLSAVERELLNNFERERILSRALTPSLHRYSFVVIDCPPALGLLTVNALVAAQEVIVPLQLEPFAVHGLQQLQDAIAVVQDGNPQLHISGVLCTMYDTRNSLSPAVATQIRERFGELVFKTMIPRNLSLSVASGAGQPVGLSEPRSAGAEAYRALAEEVIERGKA